MTAVIQNWVCDKIGVSLNLKLKNVGNQLFDGVIYYKLIEFVAPGDQCIEKPKVPVFSVHEALMNLKMLCPWLKILGVNHSPPFLKEISQKNNEACLRMLYEIYLRIEDRNHIYLVTKQREAYLLSKEEKKFKIKKVPETQDGDVDNKFSTNGLEVPLILNKPLVAKYKFQKEKILKKCKEEAARRFRKMALLHNPNFPRKEVSASCLRQSLTSKCDRDPIKQFELKKQEQTPVVSSDQKINMLDKKKRTLVKEKIKFRMFTLILQNLWSYFLTKESEEFEIAVRAKLMEQSSQEKKQAIEWAKLHSHYKNFFQQTTNDQNMSFEPPAQVEISSSGKEDEKKRLLKLHSHLFEEVANKLKEEAQSICSQAVTDLVDYSTKKSEYWQANEIAPEYVEFLWKELFYKGLPIEFEEYSHFNVKYNSHSVSADEMSCLQTKISDVLHDANLNCFLKLEGYWAKTSTAEEPALNNFAFIIHRFLNSKYPLPPHNKPVKLPNFSIKAIMGNLQNEAVFDQLKTLLELQSVALIDVNEFTNYCLGEYEKEKSYSEFACSLKSEFIESAHETKSKTEIDLYSFGLKETANKKTQFPPVTDVPKHTYIGLLGKMAFEMLNDGKSLDDVLLVSMLIEYLKTLEGKRGFVLVGFPITHFQVLVFEYFIMGKPLQINMRVFDAELQMQQPINSSILLDFDILVKNYINRNKKPCSEGELSPLKEENFSETAEEEQSDVAAKGEGKKKEKRKPKKSIDRNIELEIQRALEASKRKSPIPSSRQTKKSLSSEPSIFEINTIYSPMSSAELNRLRTSKLLPNPITECSDRDCISETYIDRYVAICRAYNYPLKAENSSRKGEYCSLFDYKACKTIRQQTNFLRRHDIPGEQIYDQFDKSTRVYVWNFDVETVTFLARILLDQEMDFQTEEMKEPFTTVLNRPDLKETHSSGNETKPEGEICEEIHFTPSPAYYDCKKLLRPRSFVRFRTSASSEHGIHLITNRELTSDCPTFVDKPINLKMQVVLATIWEEVEQSYLKQVKESLAKLLSIQTQLLPYKNYIRRINEKSLVKWDERMQIVNNFQIMFNGVEQFTRRNSTVKAELHYRVKELYDILFHLIETKKLDAEEMKNEVVNSLWVTNFIFLLANSYLRLLQHEVDRTVDSLQIITDYYTFMLGATPDTKLFQKLEIKPILLDEEEFNYGKRKSKLVHARIMSLKQSLASIDNDEEIDESVFHENSILADGLGSIRGKIKSLQRLYSNLKSDLLGKGKKKEWQDTNKTAVPPNSSPSKKGSTTTVMKRSSSKKQSALTSKKKGFAKKSLKSQTARPSTKSQSAKFPREENKSTKKVANTKSEHSIDEAMDSTVEKIKSEWDTAVRNELDRLNFRVGLIEEKATNDIEGSMQTIKYMYKDFEIDIARCYEREHQALKDIRQIFSTAIEDEVPIQPLLVFDNDNFFIDKNNILFENQPPEPPEALEEEATKFTFKISQLEKLVAKLQNVSQNGLIVETFASILHSLVASGDVPEGWRLMTKGDLAEIIRMVYGDVGVVDWKDFVIFAADLPYPTVEDLLQLKTHFETIDEEKDDLISKKQFLNTTLWFDRDFSSDLSGDLHLILSKLLLQNIFEVSSSEMNYKLFLLYFCKGEDSKEGFMKVLKVLDDKGSLCGKACALQEVVTIDAIILAKQVLENVLNHAFFTIDGIKVRTLPTDYHENIFASESNEYIKTESILMKNWLTTSKQKVSFESDMHLDTSSHDSDDYKNLLLLDERFPEPIWYKCIHYKLALMMLVFALNLHIISPDHLHRHYHIERKLKDLYRNKGIGNYIQAYHLYESPLMQEIFNTSCFFEACNLSDLVAYYINSKHPSQMTNTTR